MGDQIIGFCDRPFRRIDKARLYGLPPFQKAFVFHRIKTANAELFNPLLKKAVIQQESSALRV